MIGARAQPGQRETRHDGPAGRRPARQNEGQARKQESTRNEASATEVIREVAGGQGAEAQQHVAEQAPAQNLFEGEADFDGVHHRQRRVGELRVVGQRMGAAGVDENVLLVRIEALRSVVGRHLSGDRLHEGLERIDVALRSAVSHVFLADVDCGGVHRA